MAHTFITIRTKDHLRLNHDFYGSPYFLFEYLLLYSHLIHIDYAVKLRLSQVTFHCQKCVVLYFISL